MVKTNSYCTKFVYKSRWNYETAASLSVRYLDKCNQKIEQLLSAGFCLFYTDGNIYQILEPNNQRLIRFLREEFRKPEGLPQSLPTISGTPTAFIESAEGTNPAYFTVRCGQLIQTSQFNRKDPSESPALYAFSPDTNQQPATVVLFGQLNKSGFVRLKEAA